MNQTDLISEKIAVKCRRKESSMKIEGKIKVLKKQRICLKKLGSRREKQVSAKMR